MGATESRLGGAEQSQVVDQITTVTESPGEALDPCLERLRSLKVAGPLLTSPSAESGLKEILLEQTGSSSQFSVDDLSLDASSTVELYALFQEWQKENTRALSKRQEELGYRIEAVEALALKLLQRLTQSASVMKTTASHLEEVDKLQKATKGLKEDLRSTIDGYDALCRRINESGPDFLKSSVRNLRQRFSARQ